MDFELSERYPWFVCVCVCVSVCIMWQNLPSQIFFQSHKGTVIVLTKVYHSNVQKGSPLIFISPFELDLSSSLKAA